LLAGTVDLLAHLGPWALDPLRRSAAGHEPVPARLEPERTRPSSLLPVAPRGLALHIAIRCHRP